MVSATERLAQIRSLAERVRAAKAAAAARARAEMKMRKIYRDW